MINVLFFSRRNKVHSAGHSVYRPAKENAFLLFFLVFLIPKVKELTALVIEQTINKENLSLFVFDPEKLFTSVLPRLTLLPYF